MKNKPNYADPYFAIWNTIFVPASAQIYKKASSQVIARVTKVGYDLTNSRLSTRIHEDLNSKFNKDFVLNITSVRVIAR